MSDKIIMFDPFGRMVFIMCIPLFLKFIGRVSKNKKLNKSLRKIHKPLEIAAVALGTIHSVISIIKSPQEIGCKYIINIGFDIDCFLGGNILCKKKFKIQVVQITQNSYGFTDSNYYPTRSDSHAIIKMIGF